MAPKHGLLRSDGESQSSKRKRLFSFSDPTSSSSNPTRSPTPAESIPSFTVVYHTVAELSKDKDKDAKLSQKEMEIREAAKLHVSPFCTREDGKPGELDQFYTVTPVEDWESMKQYSSFIYKDVAFTNDQFVCISGKKAIKYEVTEDTEDAETTQATEDAKITEDTKKTNGPKDIDSTEVNKLAKLHLKDFWIGRILQIRAKDNAHVYALVAWMYWAEELPPPAVKSSDQKHKNKGQRTYHGSHELIASNYMDVLDVLTVSGAADVYHWKEEDGDVPQDVYWRQTFCRETQALSKLREHCICNGYFNPEVPMFICDNPECKIWLHEECLVKEILTKTYKQHAEDAETNGDAKPDKKSKAGKKSKISFKVKIKQEDDQPPQAVIKELNATTTKRTWTESIQCPKCNETLL